MTYWCFAMVFSAAVRPDSRTQEGVGLQQNRTADCKKDSHLYFMRHLEVTKPFPKNADGNRCCRLSEEGLEHARLMGKYLFDQGGLIKPVFAWDRGTNKLREVPPDITWAQLAESAHVMGYAGCRICVEKDFPASEKPMTKPAEKSEKKETQTAYEIKEDTMKPDFHHVVSVSASIFKKSKEEWPGILKGLAARAADPKNDKLLNLFITSCWGPQTRFLGQMCPDDIKKIEDDAGFAPFDKDDIEKQMKPSEEEWEKLGTGKKKEINRNIRKAKKLWKQIYGKWYFSGKGIKLVCVGGKWSCEVADFTRAYQKF